MGYSHPIISLVLIYLLALTNTNSLRVGDACQIARTRKSGICQLLEQCDPAQHDINNGILPTECGYNAQSKQIVCCPKTKPRVAVRSRFDQEDLPLSLRKCNEYGRYVYTNITVDVPGAETRQVDSCGHKVVPLILGGTPATLGEFPHSALLGYRSPNGQIEWDCGGSLVSTRYVLTAGHCLTSKKYKVAVSRVLLGELVLYDDSDNAIVVDTTVKQIIKYPHYRTSSRYNDIALLKLAAKIHLSPKIIPICLPTVNLYPTKSIATGWGITELGGARSDPLLKVVLESFGNEECNDFYQNIQDPKLRNGIIGTQLCAGSRTKLRDTCQGDSGGPLQIYNPDVYCMYTQVGVTSFGGSCDKINNPGVYTRVYNYVKWIEKIIWAPGEDD